MFCLYWILLPDQELLRYWLLFVCLLLLHWWLVCDWQSLLFCSTCSASSHDDQELPQGSPWRAQELGPGLGGSLQLDHGHLLTGKPRHRPVSFLSRLDYGSITYQSFLLQVFLLILTLCHLSVSICFLREAPSQNLSGLLSPSIGNLTNLEIV